MAPTHVLPALLNGIFDYAGMFPPAQLSFERALATAATFSQTLTRPYICGSELVLPIKELERLSEISPTEYGFMQQKSVSVVILGSAFDPALFMRELNHVCSTAQQLRLKKTFSITGFECKIADPESNHSTLTQLLKLYSDSPERDITLGFEPDLSLATWEQTLSDQARLFSQYYKVIPLALKIRVRGSEGSGSTGIGIDKIWKVIETVSDNNLKLKATAALHHPFIEPELYGNELGFINFLIALNLRRTFEKDFDPEMIHACLSEKDINQFSLANGIGWKDFFVTKDILLPLLKQFPTAIGSCSLQEPDQDLLRLFGEDSPIS